MSKKNYLIKRKSGYVAVVEGDREKEIMDKQAVAKIKQLIKVRHEAGKKLSKLIRGKGLTTASIYNATITLGSGE